MIFLTFTEKNARRIFRSSLEVLENSGTIAYPTESFYALGALVTDEAAVQKLYDLKKRPADKPLPVIVGDMDTLRLVVKDIPSHAESLMKKFWPGPLTIIFEARDNVPALITGGSGKVAVRIPGEGVALRLARALRVPITATSANESGKLPAEDASAVINYFGDNIDLIIDGGKTPGGKPSTIIDVTVTPPKVLRKGPVSL
ncbi:MAG: threonylcarbamoyl-AMP synthase [Nitrospiraceae bacterium]|nr:MAG: threonylcarbamoyl-AMP synthase [Nitrospiraceae bacterium]